MKITNVGIKVKCDIAGCKQYANYSIESKGFFADKNLYICDSCISIIHGWYSKKIVPKSPNNILNKNKKAGLKDEKIKS